ncbi:MULTISPECIES: 2-keto-3-deoxygluconate permease [Agrobacterium]|uniref:2-keto-3-deoxygluconate permease n=1 Tax=Agrobacterium tumefaciens TaxID=358 RepID=A0AAE6BHR6_AGRTU|nr:MULTISPECIES: 2-keto-3-deoxygluconate permease [Agrobacterium]QCL76637.1 2-keto-3-deoxygluconate permease [Agrobacterium tumefaciens]QCL82156.1 2-keto-3-deoxygluconate permease [Agrobacterium tumefaciens]CUX65664.1 2-keto-3-deoxygluconate permease 1 [Agrobacterium sp. NCPPB 925]
MEKLQFRKGSSSVPFFKTMQAVPAGMMLIPLIMGVLINSFAPDALKIGGFTQALFKDGALALIGLLIFATGAQITGSHSGKAAAATTGVVLVCKTLIPAAIAVILGLIFGLEGFWGISILALLAIMGNSNGALWLAFAGEYGDERDTGAYVASAFDDGPFLAMIFLGASGLGQIPVMALVAAIVPFALGLLVGAVDREWTRVLDSVPSITIPFMSFAVGTGISLGAVLTGGLQGLFLGVGVVLFTGGLTYLGYRHILRRGPKSGIGFAAGTTAGNAVAVPMAVAVADPRFLPFVESATAQTATAVLVTAVLAPIVASWVLRKSGGLSVHDPVAENVAAA